MSGNLSAKVSPVIAEFVMRGNEYMPADMLCRLVPYLHRVLGSQSEDYEETRARMLTLGALRIFAPLALDAAGMPRHAALLRTLPYDVELAEAGATARPVHEVESVRAAENAATAALEARWVEAASAAALSAAMAPKPAQDWASAWCGRTSDGGWAAGWSAASAARAEAAKVITRAWDAYFAVLDQALNAGPQGGSNA